MGVVNGEARVLHRTFYSNVLLCGQCTDAYLCNCQVKCVHALTVVQESMHGRRDAEEVGV